jgi:carboxypeptidase C (cathepsin A)
MNADINSHILIDIRGIALGNPWIDPFSQYDVSDYVYSFGLITQEQKNRLQEVNEQCRDQLRQGKLNQRICFSLLDDVIDSSAVGGSHRVLLYDIRKYTAGVHLFPPGRQDVESYLNREDVRQAIHALEVSKHKYVECADPPYEALAHQDGKSILPELEMILENGNVRVLVYSGQYDIICNHVGSERALRQANWSGRTDWLDAPGGVYLVNGQVAGYIKSRGNLASLLGIVYEIKKSNNFYSIYSIFCHHSVK